MYAVVIFLLFWVLIQLIQCEERCIENNPDPNVLYILQTNDNLHHLKNKAFINSLEDLFLKYGSKKLHLRPKILQNCSPHLLETMDYASELRYVIHLHVEDFYQNNYNNVLMKGFQWAGDIDNRNTTQEVCRINQKRNETDEIGTETFDAFTYEKTQKQEKKQREDTKNIACTIVTKKKRKDICESKSIVLRKNVKLVSQQVMTIPFLYNFTLNFEYPEMNRNDIEVNYKILICSNMPDYRRSEKRVDVSDLNKRLVYNKFVIKIRYDFLDKCKRELGDEVIAVFAPNPDWIEETIKPVIFYDEPLSLPDATASYTNSMIRLRSMKNLAYALLHFIKMYWNRVAIVSDGSVESDAYEELLRKLFYKDGLAFQVMTVIETNRHHDFSKVLKTLKQDKTKIIIANIDEKNVELLSKQAKYHNMTILENVLWIARSLSKATAKIAAKSLGTVFSLGSKRRPFDMYLKATNNVIDKSYHKKHYGFKNHRKFADDIRTELEHWWRNETPIEIRRTTTHMHETIGSYRNEKWILNRDLYVPRDRTGDCVLKSSNYYRHCNDNELMYLMIVIIVFAVSVLGITYFFQKPITTYNRM